MDAIHRRTFLKQAGVISLGFSGLLSCVNQGEQAAEAVRPTGFGPLVPDPARYLDLPEGFHYKLISKAGNTMNDGFLVPARADGMATFEGPDGKILIVRNHENSPEPAEFGPFGSENQGMDRLEATQLYDAGKGQKPSLGGTTTLLFNEATQEVELEYLSLAGTNRNCAGGPTPWGSWITCEEDVTPKGEFAEQDHGYVFEVPATTEIGLVAPNPIKAMGRFNHEAVCVSPETGIVYQTEDRHDSLIYRFLPTEKGKLHAGGRLQVLVVNEFPSLDTRNWEQPLVKVGQALAVSWKDIDEVEAPKDDLRYRGFEMGAACFARGEGMWHGKDELYFACTNGGPNKLGQVFRYIPSPYEGTDREAEAPAQLVLFAESEDKEVLQMCDNLTVAPWGDIILCEDNGEKNHIRGITPAGEMYTLGCNQSSGSEFAGVCFSPSGNTLFINIQANGDTLAITGPWPKERLV